jgi:hypothetical protein
VALHADFQPADPPPALEALVEAACRIRTGGHLKVGWGGQAPAAQSVDEMASRAFSAIRSRAMGRRAPAPVQSSIGNPFAIATIIQGTDRQPPIPPEDDGPLRHALHGLISASPTWRTDVLPLLSDASVTLRRTSPPYHLVYVEPRGRAVWFRDAFECRDTCSSCSCYHHNLFYGSLQVESLAEFVRATVGPIKANAAAVSVERMKVLRRAAALLGLIYGGKETYRSRSLRRQIDDNGWKAPIDTIRGNFGWGALF